MNNVEVPDYWTSVGGWTAQGARMTDQSTKKNALTLDSLTIEHRPVLPEISVVIPTVGRAILESSLCYLAQGTVWPAEIVVVDQGLSQQVESTVARFRHLGMGTVYVPSEETGRAAGLNTGFEEVTTPYVCVTDDDCFVDAAWVANMHAALAANPDTVVSGKVLSGDETVVMTATASEAQRYVKPRLSFDRMSGGNMGTSMAVIRKVGPFDESETLRTAEDGEWIYRALRKGVTLIYEPSVAVTHYGWRDEEDREEQYRRYARSQGGFYGKYIRRGDLFMAARAAWHFARATRTTARGVLTRNRELRKVGWSYITGLLPGIRAGMSDEATE